MAEKNRHGLGRDIPAATKREIRKRCGFGCVICGLGFYDYEHFAPDFCDAKEHDAEGMTLLCSQCNQKRARGRLSAESVARHNVNPKSLVDGYAQELLDVGAQGIEILFAGTSFNECQHILRVCGDSVLSVMPPEESGTPYRVSGLFADSTGEITLKITDNQWQAGADNWDVEWVGDTLTIREGPGHIVLILRTDPPSRLIVERINMKIHGYEIDGNANSFTVSREGLELFTFASCSVNSTDCFIDI